MSGKYTMTEVWATGTAILGHPLSGSATKQKVLTKARLVPASDKSRAPSPQVETPQAAAVFLALLSCDPPTDVVSCVFTAWNLPVRGSKDNLAAYKELQGDLHPFGVSLPSRSKACFGDVVRGLIEAAQHPRGSKWLRQPKIGISLWAKSNRSSVTTAADTTVYFATVSERQTLGSNERPFRREVCASVPGAALCEFAQFVKSSRLKAQQIGVQIPVEETLQALQPSSRPASPNPPSDGSPE